MLNFAPKISLRLPSIPGITHAFSSGSVGPASGDANDSALRANLVGQILAHNPTARVEFLAQFDARALGEYLEHLTSAAMPRGRMARRVRPDNTPGVVARDSRN